MSKLEEMELAFQDGRQTFERSTFTVSYRTQREITSITIKGFQIPVRPAPYNQVYYISNRDDIFKSLEIASSYTTHDGLRTHLELLDKLARSYSNVIDSFNSMRQHDPNPSNWCQVNLRGNYLHQRDGEKVAPGAYMLVQRGVVRDIVITFEKKGSRNYSIITDLNTGDRIKIKPEHGFLYLYTGNKITL